MVMMAGGGFTTMQKTCGKHPCMRSTMREKPSNLTSMSSTRWVPALNSEAHTTQDATPQIREGKKVAEEGPGQKKMLRKAPGAWRGVLGSKSGWWMGRGLHFIRVRWAEDKYREMDSVLITAPQ